MHWYLCLCCHWYALELQHCHATKMLKEQRRRDALSFCSLLVLVSLSYSLDSSWEEKLLSREANKRNGTKKQLRVHHRCLVNKCVVHKSWIFSPATLMLLICWCMLYLWGRMKPIIRTITQVDKFTSDLLVNTNIQFSDLPSGYSKLHRELESNYQTQNHYVLVRSSSVAVDFLLKVIEVDNLC